MKINKNVVLEYLYLTIFVITLFVLKELIEYVFFTRKRNNIIEHFNNTESCTKIGWYYREYDNIKKIFDIFDGLQTSGSATTLGNAKMKVDNYVEFKKINAINNGSRIVLQPANQAIYFEKFDSTNTTGLCYCIIFRPHPHVGTKKVLDFVKYAYRDNQVEATDFKEFVGYTHIGTTPTTNIFARFDAEGNYSNMNINVALNELIGKH